MISQILGRRPSGAVEHKDASLVQDEPNSQTVGGWERTWSRPLALPFPITSGQSWRQGGTGFYVPLVGAPLATLLAPRKEKKLARCQTAGVSGCRWGQTRSGDFSVDVTEVPWTGELLCVCPCRAPCCWTLASRQPKPRNAAAACVPPCKKRTPHSSALCKTPSLNAVSQGGRFAWCCRWLLLRRLRLW